MMTLDSPPRSLPEMCAAEEGKAAVLQQLLRRLESGLLTTAEITHTFASLEEALLGLERDEATAILRESNLTMQSVMPWLRFHDADVVDAAARIVAIMAGQGHHLQRVELADGLVRLKIRCGRGISTRVWPAAICAAEECVLHTALDVRGGAVLELGCGTGLVGIAAALAGAASVIVTDHDEAALQLARVNVDLNSLAEAVRVERLDWTEPEASRVAALGPFDTVVASDPLYDVGQAEALSKTIATLISPNKSSRALIVAHRDQARSQDAANAIACFSEEMRARGMRKLSERVFRTDRAVSPTHACARDDGGADQSSLVALLYAVEVATTSGEADDLHRSSEGAATCTSCCSGHEAESAGERIGATA